MMGNVQAGFKSAEELAKIEEKRGGVKGMSSEDIFDKEKYIEMMKKEMPQHEFMEIFVHKQAFSVFIEDLYPIIKRAYQA